MKMTLFLVAAGMAVLSAGTLFAGEKPQSSVSKPQRDIRLWCEVKGLYTQIQDGHGGTIEKCEMVSSAHCFYIPCSPSDAAPWPTNVLQLKPVAVPSSVHIEEGQNFIARYDNDVLKIKLLDYIEQEFSTDGNGVTSFSVHY